MSSAKTQIATLIDNDSVNNQRDQAKCSGERPASNTQIKPIDEELENRLTAQPNRTAAPPDKTDCSTMTGMIKASVFAVDFSPANRPVKAMNAG